MSSPDTHAFNSLITSIEEPIESLESTKDVIDKYLADSFDSFIKKLNITLKGKDSPLFVEVEDDTEVSQNSDESKRKKFHSVLISDYLVDLTKKMRGVIVHNLMNLVDDRLVRNQKAFLHVKNKCLERLHASRDSSVLYRNVLEASMTTKYSESVRIMKDQYKETIVKENTTLSKDLSDMQSTYRTLWTLHDQLTLQLTKSNNSVDILHEKIRSSYEDTYALRESNALLQDRHENYLENILKEVKKRVKKLKRKKRLNPSNLEELDLESSSFTKIRFQDNADSDIDDESDTDDDAKNIALEIKLKNELLLQPCQTCLTHQTEITELKIRLDAAFSQLNRKKSNRTDINAEKNFGIINSQLSTGTPIKFQKSEYLMDPGPAFHKYSRGNSDEDMSFYNSLHSQILDNVRQGINVEDVGGKSKGKVRAGSISNLLYYIDDNNESVEYDDEDDDDDVIQKKEMNKNNFQHSRSKSQENSILESSALAVQDPLKDFLKTLTPRKSFSRKADIAISSPHPVNSNSNPNLNAMDTATQTEHSVDILLKTYFDAAKQAAAMYIESTKEVNTLQSNALTLNTDKEIISSELEKTQKYLTDTDDLRTLQLKERNFLIKELSDQLIAVRRKLFLEDQYNGSRRRSISQDPSDKKEKLEKKLSMKGKISPLPTIKFTTPPKEKVPGKKNILCDPTQALEYPLFSTAISGSFSSTVSNNTSQKSKDERDSQKSKDERDSTDARDNAINSQIVKIGSNISDESNFKINTESISTDVNIYDSQSNDIMNENDSNCSMSNIVINMNSCSHNNNSTINIKNTATATATTTNITDNNNTNHNNTTTDTSTNSNNNNNTNTNTSVPTLSHSHPSGLNTPHTPHTPKSTVTHSPKSTGSESPSPRLRISLPSVVTSLSDSAHSSPCNSTSPHTHSPHTNSPHTNRSTNSSFPPTIQTHSSLSTPPLSSLNKSNSEKFASELNKSIVALHSEQVLNDFQTENKIENTSPHTPRLSLSCNSLDSNIKNSKLIAQRSMKKNRTNSVNLVTVLEEKNLITPHNLFTPQKSLRNFEEDNNIREKSEKSEKGEKSEKNEGICNPLPYFSPIKSIDISRDRISLSSRVDDNVNEMDTVIDLIQKTIPQMQMSEESLYDLRALRKQIVALAALRSERKGKPLNYGLKQNEKIVERKNRQLLVESLHKYL